VRPRWGERERRGVKVGLLAVVLVGHFLSRQHLVQALPGAESMNYPYVYRTALALLAGHGFGIYRISDAPESRAVVEFLNGQRDGLSRTEFRRFLDGPDGQPVPFPIPEAAASFPPGKAGCELATPVNPLHTSRVLDIYTAALLWRLFGLRWSVLLTSCALVSTGACLLVFFIARRVGGGFWPGLGAAVLFLASPLENDYAIRCLRDVSPLWFAVLAFAAFVCLVERFRSAAANCAALGLTGLLAALGCGWRSDALLLVPFLGAASAVVLLRRRRSLRYLLAGGAVFLIGAAVPLTAVRLLCPGQRSSLLIGFHIAYYGEFSRCNLLGLENTFEVARDDVDTDMAAQQDRADRDRAGGAIEFLSPAYGSACFRIYCREAPQNAYRWLSSFPWFYLRALDACRLRDLPAAGWLPSPPPRPRWLAALAPWVLDPLSAVAPWLFALGACVSLLRPGARWSALCLIVFSVFYAAVLFLVLPEFKHAGPLILPLTVLGGVGLASLRGLAQPRVLAASARTALWPAVYLAAGLAVAALLWGVACGGAYYYSLGCRRALLDAVAKRAADGTPAPEALRSPQAFSVVQPPDKEIQQVGYLLRIAAGPGESFLECRHIHHADGPTSAGVLHTRHRLLPNREQCFFVVCRPGGAFGDPRTHVCTAFLDGTARFLSCTCVPLSAWRRPPVTTVFAPGEASPGNSVVGGTPSVTLFAEPPDWNFIGITAEEAFRCGLAAPAALFPSADGGNLGASLASEGWRPIAARGRTETVPGGLRVWIDGAPGGCAAETPLLTAPADGTYLFRLRYRPEEGKLTLGALAEDGHARLALCTSGDPPGVEAVRSIQVKLLKGQKFSLMVADGGAEAEGRTVFVLEELLAYRDGSCD
jgi:hypothetical protein